jgi:small subunit ribosomal protein S20
VSDADPIDGEGNEKLANSKSAEKRIRVAERRRARNRPYRSAARTFVKKAELAIRAGDQDVAASAVGDAISMLDRVAGKGIIHTNHARRRKSRLMAQFSRLGEPSA